MIGRIAAQTFVIDEELGREAVLVDESLDVEYFIGFIVLHQRDDDVFVEQLKSVAVSGGDDDLKVLRGGLSGERADDVICLVILDADGFDPDCGGELVEHGELGGETGRHFIAIALIIGEHLIAKSFFADVESDCGGAWAMLLKQFQKHVDKADDAAGQDAVVRERGQSVEGTIEQTAAVDEEKLFHTVKPPVAEIILRASLRGN